jgi:hypothetical protein
MALFVLNPHTYPLLQITLTIWHQWLGHEPNGPEIIQAYYDISKLFQTVGWANCIQAFKGHNIKVVRAFAQSFNGKRAKVGDVELLVDETFIAEATGLSLRARDGLRMLHSRTLKY